MIVHIIAVDKKMKTKTDSFMEKKRQEMQQEFLKLTPLQRIRKMNAVFNDIIAFKAKNMGVAEYEIYRRYLKARDQNS
jgi:hypothetical protein